MPIYTLTTYRFQIVSREKTYDAADLATACAMAMADDDWSRSETYPEHETGFDRIIAEAWCDEEELDVPLAFDWSAREFARKNAMVKTLKAGIAWMRRSGRGGLPECAEMSAAIAAIDDDNEKVRAAITLAGAC